MHLCCCYWAPPQLGKKVRFLGTDAAAPLTFSWPWCGCCTLIPSSVLHLLEQRAARVGTASAGIVLVLCTILPSLYSPICLPSDVPICGSLRHPNVLCRGTHEGYKCSTNCIFTGGYKGFFSLYHDANITPRYIYFKIFTSGFQESVSFKK